MLQQGRPGEAAELYHVVLRRAPEHPDALHLLAIANYQLGDAGRAVELARRAVAAQPRAADYHNNLGRFYLSLGKINEAIQSLDQALQLNASHAAAVFNLGCALAADARREESLSHLRRYTEMAPSDPGGFHQLGIVLGDLGRHSEAAACFERVLELNPGIPEAYNNLGNALQGAGKLEESLARYHKALELKPDYAEGASNLGAAYQAQGRLEEAEHWYRRALEIQPGMLAARGNLANLLAARRRHEEAAAAYQELLVEHPESVETWNNLGNALQELGWYDEALKAYQEALRRKPDYNIVHNNIGNTLRKQGQSEPARREFELALDHDPNFAEALNNLGVTLQDLGRGPEAVEKFERAIEIRPAYVDPIINLGNYWRDHGRPQIAVSYLKRALELAPGNPYPWNNLGCLLGDLGQVEEGIACYQEALKLMPENWLAYSNILLNMHYLSRYTPDEKFTRHLEFARRFAAGLMARRQPHERNRNTERRLRVGYVSADFRRHSVAYFLEPVVEHHDPAKFEVFCYSDVTRPDVVTDEFRKLAGAGWRDVRGYNHESFDELVRRDQIDILVDTGGHTANSRLLSFALQPAPVQVTWLGYPDTTGLETIGYRITDGWADPPGATERWHTEKLARLECGFLCFRPPRNSPAVTGPPCLAGQPLTFGSFNSMSKLSDETLESWAEILRRVPGSRLALKNKALSEPEPRAWLLERLAKSGVAGERVPMSGAIASLSGHLDAYGYIDVALDTWPYHGTTTTCEALWMGVPVVTQAGEAHLSRVGVSLLDAVGLSDLVAATPQEYVNNAVRLSQNREWLVRLRGELRERIRGSRLTDEHGFIQTLEAAYREMWQAWCLDQ